MSESLDLDYTGHGKIKNRFIIWPADESASIAYEFKSQNGKNWKDLKYTYRLSTFVSRSHYNAIIFYRLLPVVFLQISLERDKAWLRNSFAELITFVVRMPFCLGDELLVRSWSPRTNTRGEIPDRFRFVRQYINWVHIFFFTQSQSICEHLLCDQNFVQICLLLL